MPGRDAIQPSTEAPLTLGLLGACCRRKPKYADQTNAKFVVSALSTPPKTILWGRHQNSCCSHLSNLCHLLKHPGPPFSPLSISKWPLIFLDGKNRGHWRRDFITSQALFPTVFKLICIPVTLSYGSPNYKEKAIPFIWDFLLLSVPLMSFCLPLGSCPSITLLSSTSHLSLPSSLGFTKMFTSPFKDITVLLQPMPFSSSLCILLFLDKLLEEMIHLLLNLAFLSTIPFGMTSLFLLFSLTSLSNYSQPILFPLTSLSSYSQLSFHLVNKHWCFRYSTYYSHTIFHLNQDTLQRER